jgi:hypothetical protein
MAGDTKELGATVPDEIVIDPFERIAAQLEAQGGALVSIFRELASIGYETWGPFQSAAAVVTNRDSQHIRFRVRGIIITTDAAGVVSLVIGSGTYPFVIAAGNLAPPMFPLPLVIERASDVSFTSSVAATMACYLIGRPE